VLVPLFVNLFRRADELATAMEARCYRGGAGRTRLRESVLTAVDWLVFVSGSAAMVIVGVVL
jgi:energy-coupling factor transport system permease protein